MALASRNPLLPWAGASRRSPTDTLGAIVPTKRIVCLANSRKLSGRCIAGRELAEGVPQGWIRPVGSREHEEVSEREREYQDGEDPQILDVIDVPLLEPRPRTFQRENWLLDPDHYWSRVERLRPRDLVQFTDEEGPLWLNVGSTVAGRNDRIPLEQANQLASSLKLVAVAAVKVAVFSPGAAFGNPKRRVQARFEFAGAHYALWVTDPVYERRFLTEPDGDYALGPCYLTVSLGEPFEGFVYKMVAAIIEADG